MTVEVYNSHCSSLHKDGYILINHRPCKITDLSNPRGAATIRLVCTDIFTGQRFEERYPPSQDVVIPNVSRYACRLISIDDGAKLLEIMEEVSMSLERVAIPGGQLGHKIRTAFEGLEENKAVDISIVAAMGEKAAVDYHVVRDIQDEFF
ncbi:eukaryotic translation initiation factor 5A [Dissophora ornata]|nr:Eukaryotic translation initiation factor 5A [Dissophora ornata]KAI8596012.1 eukaryotic translation initiation factor 5A [Dissophora ornata]